MERAAKRPNTILRYQRQKRGWSQQRVADLLDTSENVVSRWERGERSPSPFYQEKLCDLFGLTADKLGFLEGRQEAIAPVHRHPGVHHASGSAAGSTLGASSQEVLSRLSLALKRSSIDQTTLTHLEALTSRYWRLLPDLSGLVSSDLLQVVEDHLQKITTLLECSQPTYVYKRLCTLAGETAEIAGRMLFFLHHYAASQAYYQIAFEAAQQAENAALSAVALGHVGFIHTYSGHPHLALPLLAHARRLAQHQAPAPVCAWLAAVEAEAHANAGELAPCLSALAAAEMAADDTPPEADPYWVGLDRSRLAGYKGVCSLRLQRPEAAVAALEESLIHLDPAAAHRRSYILVDLALAYAQQGELEEACKHGKQALALTLETKATIVLQRLLDFQKYLHPWGDVPAVCDFDEQLRLVATAIGR